LIDLLLVEEEEQSSQPSAHICVTPELIPLIRAVLEEEREYQSISIDYRLCSSVCPHVSQKKVAVGGDWSCGYRNIQMICHTLMALPSYRRALFNGNGEVPDVQGIQAWIEKAWAAGFDQEVSLLLFPVISPRVAFNLVGLSWEHALGLEQQVKDLR
jgi:hypothetical protein